MYLLTYLLCPFEKKPLVNIYNKYFFMHSVTAATTCSASYHLIKIHNGHHIPWHTYYTICLVGWVGRIAQKWHVFALYYLAKYPATLASAHFIDSGWRVIHYTQLSEKCTLEAVLVNDISKFEVTSKHMVDRIRPSFYIV